MSFCKQEIPSQVRWTCQVKASEGIFNQAIWPVCWRLLFLKQVLCFSDLPRSPVWHSIYSFSTKKFDLAEFILQCPDFTERGWVLRVEAWMVQILITISRISSFYKYSDLWLGTRWLHPPWWMVSIRLVSIPNGAVNQHVWSLCLNSVSPRGQKPYYLSRHF